MDRRWRQQHSRRGNHQSAGQHGADRWQLAESEHREDLRDDKKDNDVGAHQPAKIDSAKIDHNAVQDQAARARRQRGRMPVKSHPHQGVATHLKHRRPRQRREKPYQKHASMVTRRARLNHVSK